jgi:hypothetical protein
MEFVSTLKQAPLALTVTAVVGSVVVATLALQVCFLCWGSLLVEGAAILILAAPKPLFRAGSYCCLQNLLADTKGFKKTWEVVCRDRSN